MWVRVGRSGGCGHGAAQQLTDLGLTSELWIYAYGDAIRPGCRAMSCPLCHCQPIWVSIWCADISGGFSPDC